MQIYVCEDSMEGIFSAIYDAWKNRHQLDEVMIQQCEEENMRLFSQYIDVETSHEKSEKVLQTLKKRMYEEDFTAVYQAALSNDAKSGDSIFRVVVYALTGQVRKPIGGNLQNAAVEHVFRLSRKVGNEAHRYLGFVRFKELENGILFSEIAPENRILPLIGDHFANRYPREHFLIYDSTHHIFLVHQAGKQWFLLEEDPSESFLKRMATVSERETETAKCWQLFCNTIAIKERQNTILQKQLLPLKFRAYMTENYKNI